MEESRKRGRSGSPPAGARQAKKAKPLDKEALKAKLAASKARVAQKLAQRKAAGKSQTKTPAVAEAAAEAAVVPAAGAAEAAAEVAVAPAVTATRKDAPVFDQSLGRGGGWGGRRRRRAKAFQFIRRGTLVAKAEQAAAMAAEACVEGAVSERGVEAYYSWPREADGPVADGGLVEWWDARIESAGGVESLDALIEHPVPIAPPVRTDKTAIKAPPLTRKERRKIRMRRRKAEEEERAIKVRLGLEKAPPPKVRLSNMMRVMGLEAVANPTAVEAKVKAEVNARVEAHFAANAKAALTPAQRKAKLAKKREEDTTQHVRVAVFRVEYLEPFAWRTNIVTNAKHWFLTGYVLKTPQFSVIIVEGGPKGVAKFTRWMTQKVRWSDTSIIDYDTKRRAGAHAKQVTAGVPEQDRISLTSDLDRAAVSGNACTLAWTGWVRRRAFAKFSIPSRPTSLVDGRTVLDSKNIAHYLDLAARLGKGPRAADLPRADVAP